MAYTAAQYAAQDRLMALARWSCTTGLCPVCRVRPLADWPDGVRRATCASRDCHAAASTHDGFAVGLVIGLID